MQDPNTGDMIEISNETAVEAEKNGFCVLQTGETVNISGVNCIVYKFTHKDVILDLNGNIPALTPNIPTLKIGQKINLKGGLFSIKSIGEKFVCLRGLPSGRIINQTLIDEYKKKQVAKLRK